MSKRGIIWLYIIGVCILSSFMVSAVNTASVSSSVAPGGTIQVSIDSTNFGKYVYFYKESDRTTPIVTLDLGCVDKCTSPMTFDFTLGTKFAAGKYILAIYFNDLNDWIYYNFEVTAPLAAVIYGDVTDDGSVNMADLNMMVDMLLMRIPMPVPGTRTFLAADVTGDGRFDMADLNALVDYLLMRTSKFPVEEVTLVCTDDDGGFKTNVFGTVVDKSGATALDICKSDDKTLEEKTCGANNELVSSEYDCSKDGLICSGGRCTSSGGGGGGGCGDTPSFCEDSEILMKTSCGTNGEPIGEEQYCENGCVNNECASIPASTCTDSDGGVNPDVPGSLGSNNDVCLNDDYLIEVTCGDNGKLSGVYVYCENGCANGKCNPAPAKTCKDSDNGDFPYEFGYVDTTDENGVSTNDDLCSETDENGDSWGVFETICNDKNELEIREDSCPLGCLDGKCISKEAEIFSEKPFFCSGTTTINPFVKGSCKDDTGEFKDKCQDSNTVVKNYCTTEGLCKSEVKVCKYGCKEGEEDKQGACVHTACEGNKLITRDDSNPYRKFGTDTDCTLQGENVVCREVIDSDGITTASCAVKGEAYSSCGGNRYLLSNGNPSTDVMQIINYNQWGDETGRSDCGAGQVCCSAWDGLKSTPECRKAERGWPRCIPCDEAGWKMIENHPGEMCAMWDLEGAYSFCHSGGGLQRFGYCPNCVEGDWTSCNAPVEFEEPNTFSMEPLLFTDVKTGTTSANAGGITGAAALTGMVTSDEGADADSGSDEYLTDMYYGVDPELYHTREIIPYTDSRFYDMWEYRIVTEDDDLMCQADFKVAQLTGDDVAERKVNATVRFIVSNVSNATEEKSSDERQIPCELISTAQQAGSETYDVYRCQIVDEAAKFAKATREDFYDKNSPLIKSIRGRRIACSMDVTFWEYNADDPSYPKWDVLAYSHADTKDEPIAVAKYDFIFLSDKNEKLRWYNIYEALEGFYKKIPQFKPDYDKLFDPEKIVKNVYLDYQYSYSAGMDLTNLNSLATPLLDAVKAGYGSFDNAKDTIVFVSSNAVADYNRATGKNEVGFYIPNTPIVVLKSFSSKEDSQSLINQLAGTTSKRIGSLCSEQGYNANYKPEGLSDLFPEQKKNACNALRAQEKLTANMNTQLKGAFDRAFDYYHQGVDGVWYYDGIKPYINVQPNDLVFGMTDVQPLSWLYSVPDGIVARSDKNSQDSNYWMHIRLDLERTAKGLAIINYYKSKMSDSMLLQKYIQYSEEVDRIIERFREAPETQLSLQIDRPLQVGEGTKLALSEALRMQITLGGELNIRLARELQNTVDAAKAEIEKKGIEKKYPNSFAVTLYGNLYQYRLFKIESSFAIYDITDKKGNEWMGEIYPDGKLGNVYKSNAGAIKIGWDNFFKFYWVSVNGKNEFAIWNGLISYITPGGAKLGTVSGDTTSGNALNGNVVTLFDEERIIDNLAYTGMYGSSYAREWAKVAYDEKLKTPLSAMNGVQIVNGQVRAPLTNTVVWKKTDWLRTEHAYVKQNFLDAQKLMYNSILKEAVKADPRFKSALQARYQQYTANMLEDSLAELVVNAEGTTAETFSAIELQPRTRIANTEYSTAAADVAVKDAERVVYKAFGPRKRPKTDSQREAELNLFVANMNKFALSRLKILGVQDPKIDPKVRARFVADAIEEQMENNLEKTRNYYDPVAKAFTSGGLDDRVMALKNLGLVKWFHSLGSKGKVAQDTAILAEESNIASGIVQALRMYSYTGYDGLSSKQKQRLQEAGIVSIDGKFIGMPTVNLFKGSEHAFEEVWIDNYATWGLVAELPTMHWAGGVVSALKTTTFAEATGIRMGRFATTNFPGIAKTSFGRFLTSVDAFRLGKYMESANYLTALGSEAVAFGAVLGTGKAVEMVVENGVWYIVGYGQRVKLSDSAAGWFNNIPENLLSTLFDTSGTFLENMGMFGVMGAATPILKGFPRVPAFALETLALSSYGFTVAVGKGVVMGEDLNYGKVAVDTLLGNGFFLAGLKGFGAVQAFEARSAMNNLRNSLNGLKENSARTDTIISKIKDKVDRLEKATKKREATINDIATRNTLNGEIITELNTLVKELEARKAEPGMEEKLAALEASKKRLEIDLKVGQNTVKSEELGKKLRAALEKNDNALVESLLLEILANRNQLFDFINQNKQWFGPFEPALVNVERAKLNLGVLEINLIKNRQALQRQGLSDITKQEIQSNINSLIKQVDAQRKTIQKMESELYKANRDYITRNYGKTFRDLLMEMNRKWIEEVKKTDPAAGAELEKQYAAVVADNAAYDARKATEAAAERARVVDAETNRILTNVVDSERALEIQREDVVQEVLSNPSLRTKFLQAITDPRLTFRADGFAEFISRRENSQLTAAEAVEKFSSEMGTTREVVVQALTPDEAAVAFKIGILNPETREVVKSMLGGTITLKGVTDNLAAIKAAIKAKNAELANPENLASKLDGRLLPMVDEGNSDAAIAAASGDLVEGKPIYIYRFSMETPVFNMWWQTKGMRVGKEGYYVMTPNGPYVYTPELGRNYYGNVPAEALISSNDVPELVSPQYAAEAVTARTRQLTNEMTQKLKEYATSNAFNNMRVRFDMLSAIEANELGDFLPEYQASVRARIAELRKDPASIDSLKKSVNEEKKTTTGGEEITYSLKDGWQEGFKMNEGDVNILIEKLDALIAEVRLMKVVGGKMLPTVAPVRTDVSTKGKIIPTPLNLAPEMNPRGWAAMAAPSGMPFGVNFDWGAIRISLKRMSEENYENYDSDRVKIARDKVASEHPDWTPERAGWEVQMLLIRFTYGHELTECFADQIKAGTGYGKEEICDAIGALAAGIALPSDRELLNKVNARIKETERDLEKDPTLAKKVEAEIRLGKILEYLRAAAEANGRPEGDPHRIDDALFNTIRKFMEVEMKEALEAKNFDKAAELQVKLENLNDLDVDVSLELTEAQKADLENINRQAREEEGVLAVQLSEYDYLMRLIDAEYSRRQAESEGRKMEIKAQLMEEANRKEFILAREKLEQVKTGKIKYVRELATRGHVEAKDKFMNLMDSVINNVLAGEVPGATVVDGVVRGNGIVDVKNPNLPYIIIPDLHARRGMLMEILYTIDPHSGKTFFELMKEGKLNVIFLGDIMHSEQAALLRLLAGKEAINAEMIDSLNALEMGMELKNNFGENFYWARGNHEAVTEGLAKKTRQGEVDISGAVRDWIYENYGADFFEKLSKFEKSLPLMIRGIPTAPEGKGFVASHSGPDGVISEADIRAKTDAAWKSLKSSREYAPPAEHPGAWSIMNFDAAQTMMGNLKVSQWFVGHSEAKNKRPGVPKLGLSSGEIGLYDLLIDSNGKQMIRLNNPKRTTYAYVPVEGFESLEVISGQPNADFVKSVPGGEVFTGKWDPTLTVIIPRAAVPNPAPMPESLVKMTKTIPELNKLIENLGSFSSSSGTKYTPEILKGVIDDVVNGRRPLDDLTISHGIRDQVASIIIKNTGTIGAIKGTLIKFGQLGSSRLRQNTYTGEEMVARIENVENGGNIAQVTSLYGLRDRVEQLLVAQGITP